MHLVSSIDHLFYERSCDNAKKSKNHIIGDSLIQYHTPQKDIQLVPGNKRDHPPTVFDSQFDIVRNRGCWDKVSRVNTQSVVMSLQKPDDHFLHHTMVQGTKQ